MKIVLDFQACQSGSRYRGIGRASYSLMLAMGQYLTKQGHEVICLLSEALNDGLNALREDLQTQLPRAALKTFRIPSPCAAAWPENAWRQMAGRLLREHAIACLEPDFVHIPALLADGWGDDSVASVGLLGPHIPVALTQHDLIPLVMADNYMLPGPFRNYYMIKLENVKEADLLLAISKFSQQEVIELLGIAQEKVVHISSAADNTFWFPSADPKECELSLAHLGVRPSFLMYAPGGFDYRKNLDRLFQAYALLPATFRKKHQLVIASQLDPGRREALERDIQKYQLEPEDVVLTDYVSDEVLRNLYRNCFAYVFPSLHEGFGLPALEAMSCGAAVIASNCTSIPEVLDLEVALFDAYDSESIAKRLLELEENPKYRARLLEHAKKQPKKFSWERSGTVAVEAILERHHALLAEGWKRVLRSELPACNSMIERVQLLVPGVQPTKGDLALFKECYEYNLGH